ncbi:hypothetical protein CR513_61486, partial [Mucuna pruriens]
MWSIQLGLSTGLLGCKAWVAETTLVLPRWSRTDQDDFISAETPFIISTRKPESDEELLKMFRKVEIDIPLFTPSSRFLIIVCAYGKKMKGSVEVGGIMLALTKNEEIISRAQALLKKC